MCMWDCAKISKKCRKFRHFFFKFVAYHEYLSHPIANLCLNILLLLTLIAVAIPKIVLRLWQIHFYWNVVNTNQLKNTQTCLLCDSTYSKFLSTFLRSTFLFGIFCSTFRTPTYSYQKYKLFQYVERQAYIINQIYSAYCFWYI